MVSVETPLNGLMPSCAGVPQGTVLGPVLFNIFIDDIINDIDSEIRLFADDCVCYRQIRSKDDCEVLQKDIRQLGKWAEYWNIWDFNHLNVKLCILQEKPITRSATYTSWMIHLWTHSHKQNTWVWQLQMIFDGTIMLWNYQKSKQNTRPIKTQLICLWSYSQRSSVHWPSASSPRICKLRLGPTYWSTLQWNWEGCNVELRDSSYLTTTITSLDLSQRCLRNLAGKPCNNVGKPTGWTFLIKLWTTLLPSHLWNWLKNHQDVQDICIARSGIF